ncbi:NUDIX hydrolase [Spirulina major CS-329]|uniref:NUDIX hydrolase n=1 Tax=Spirulina TaxID=1154 RepID=UPI00232DDE80|nr:MULTISPECIES: NUDIX hydrolase [Spirulina]MDB9494919.1 NUDIX hydrolase [Spirulina subsalsa CS-330]MDB9504146.1 NUDIX hydrolase [Spirulina major CS-329]
MPIEPDHWETLVTLATVRSPWLTLIAERLRDRTGQDHDYWRVEKADSVIILPIHRHHILLPAPQYRPGVGQATWDFPGGRVPDGGSPEAIAPAILTRELGITPDAISTLTALNTTGWLINSSFSNQKLYGFVAELDPHHDPPSLPGGARYPHTRAGITQLRQDLTCLQCRTVLIEYGLAQQD